MLYCKKCESSTVQVELGSKSTLLCLTCYKRTDSEQSFEANKKEDSAAMREMRAKGLLV